MDNMCNKPMTDLNGISEAGEVVLRLKESDIEILEKLCAKIGSSSASATIIYLIRQYGKQKK